METLLKKTAAFLGLVALAPIAYQLVIGDLTPTDAGIRAGITLLGVLVIRRLISMLGQVLDSTGP